MDDLAIVVLIVLVGFLVRAVLAGRRCRCADDGPTTERPGDEVISTPTVRGVEPSALVTASATVEMRAAPARITRVGY